jgi:hypothetical protein
MAVGGGATLAGGRRGGVSFAATGLSGGRGTGGASAKIEGLASPGADAGAEVGSTDFEEIQRQPAHAPPPRTTNSTLAVSHFRPLINMAC